MIYLMQSKTLLLQDPSRVFRAIILCLEQLISESSSSPMQSGPFNLKTPPSVSMTDYLRRIFKFMNCSLSVFIYALILLDRAQQNNPQFAISNSNIHRLLISAHVVAAKYLDDFFYKNSYYATIGGIAVSVLNQLEVEFLALLNFNCEIPSNTFIVYCDKLQEFLNLNDPGLNFVQGVKPTKDAFKDKTLKENDNKENLKKRQAASRLSSLAKQKSLIEEQRETAQEEL